MVKHVFFVQSQITKLVAFATIKYLALPRDSIVIVSYRKVDFYDGYSIVPCPFSHYPQESFLIHKKFWLGRKKLKNLDDYVQQITNNSEFKFYVPHTFYNHVELMLSHGKCQSFSLLEEGKTSFSRFGERTLITDTFPQNILKRMNYGTRLKSVKQIFPDNYETAFRISDAAFPDFPRVQQVKPYLVSATYDYEHIIVLDSIVEAGVVSISDYLIALLRFIMIMLKRGIHKNHYKFHPDQQPKTSRKLIIELFKTFEDIEFIKIDKNIVLEEMAVNTSDKFYSAISSMLYYSRYLGSQAYSFVNLFPSSEKLDSYLKKQPEAFLKQLEYLT